MILNMDSNGKKLISILIPAYNEHESLPPLYDRLVKLMDSQTNYDFEVLFVNDGSKDNTLDLIKFLRKKDTRINYVNLSRNYGKEVAMAAGFDYIRGDALVLMDADLQDPPFLILNMIKYWEEGYEDVYARRNDRGKESWLRKSFSFLFYKILEHSTRFEVLTNVGDFRLLDKVCIEALKKLRESERYTKGMFCWIGFRKKEIIFNRGNRVAGKSNWNFWSLFNLAIEGITSFTTTPLRFSSILGFIIAFLSLGLMLFYFIKALIWGDPIQGFPTLVVIILFLGGIQLLSIGILGEYIGRIFNESKSRPVYIAREYNGKKIY